MCSYPSVYIRNRPLAFRAAIAVESIQGVRQEVVDAISKATANCLTDTDVGMGTKRVVGSTHTGRHV